jgi:hypothetical protein
MLDGNLDASDATRSSFFELTNPGSDGALARPSLSASLGMIGPGSPGRSWMRTMLMRDRPKGYQVNGLRTGLSANSKLIQPNYYCFNSSRTRMFISFLEEPDLPRLKYQADHHCADVS